MPPSYDTDVVTVVFRKLRSLLMAAYSSEGQAINTKLFYMIFLAIRIEYMFHEHHSHPEIKVPKSTTMTVTIDQFTHYLSSTLNCAESTEAQLKQIPPLECTKVVRKSLY
ncbi:hypothetical protein TYRP_012375 [Tyrophagus putrescentiae]|nr:hypothetical protein TYRP_012375 [Tyrophagus putrescentiae]